jgi:translation elongation factor EF-Ts
MQQSNDMRRSLSSFTEDELKLAQQLRVSIGAGIMQCKAALLLTNFNMCEAEVWLQQHKRFTV